MSVTGEAMRAVGESRNWYARQSQMTVFGTVPSLQDVQQNFSDCLAMAVGITSNGGGGVGCRNAKAGNGSNEFGGQRLVTVVNGSESLVQTGIRNAEGSNPSSRSVLDSPANRTDCRGSDLPASTFSRSPSSQLPNPSPAGRASFQLDPPGWDEVVTNYADRRGV